MDVLIKGYDMPKCCNDCAFHKEGRIIKSVKSSDIIYKIIVKCEICRAEDPYISYKDADTKRRDDCPLIEIPPHGRLVDADRLENIFWDILNKPDEYDKPLHDMVLELQTAPTVIEGEEQGNKSKSVERRGTTIIEGYADDGGLMPTT